MDESDVLRLSDTDLDAAASLLSEFGLELTLIPVPESIPGSHWGFDEAGLIQNTLYARTDTPVHSLLHETCHWILMSAERRSVLHTDAGGSAVEEAAVCYLQILLADRIPGMSARRMCRDMDRWGYSFRLGSTLRWFQHDSEDARAYLLHQRIALETYPTELLTRE